MIYLFRFSYILWQHLSGNFKIVVILAYYVVAKHFIERDSSSDLTFVCNVVSCFAFGSSRSFRSLGTKHNSSLSSQYISILITLSSRDEKSKSYGSVLPGETGNWIVAILRKLDLQATKLSCYCSRLSTHWDFSFLIFRRFFLSHERQKTKIFLFSVLILNKTM